MYKDSNIFAMDLNGRSLECANRDELAKSEVDGEPWSDQNQLFTDVYIWR